VSQLKVIGAGLGRTGTSSLKAALEELGFGPCYHMVEVFANPGHADFWRAAWRGEPADWDGVLGPYEATVDWPGCAFYEELMERNPDAKVILSVRDPERWYESTRQTIYKVGKLGTGSPFSRLGFALTSRLAFGRFKTGQAPMTEEIAWQGTFGGRFEDKDHAMEVFNRHNGEVRRRVPEGRLLVYEVKQGWGPLCEFLGVEVPDKPFPHLNDAADMRRLILMVRAFSVAVPTALAMVVGIAALALLRRGSH
jgi:sulfotransferase family protein